MHWHNTAEWAYMLKVCLSSSLMHSSGLLTYILGDIRISTLTPQGQIYVADVVGANPLYIIN